MSSSDADQGALAAASRIAPLLRAHAARAESRRRLCPPVLDALASAGLFRLLAPRSLAGLEADPASFARVLEEVSAHDSAAGWAVMIGNYADWWCSRLPDEGVEEIYAAGPDALIAAVIHPPMQARPAEGGYRITGRGSLASHVHAATWIMVTAFVDGRLTAMIVPVREVRIVDTWDSLGMRGTDSQDVALEDVFVPTRRTFPFVRGAPLGTHYTGPLYRVPAMAAVGISIAPIALAIGRAALVEIRELAGSKRPYASTRALGERPVAQAAYARAEGILRSARALFYDTVEGTWERARAGTPSTPEQKADDLLAAVHAVASSVKAVELACDLAGTSAIYAGHPLERHFRDIQTLRHHGFTSESRYETVGQVYFGVAPEWGLVDF